jgi:hypothetical protein
MATLVLGAFGTLVGGPLGGAIGATLGRSLDASIIGSPRREGPRLKELAVSTSSYGSAIPALYGRVRVPGTIIWASDLSERRESSGGGKGRPATTRYAYSVSLAVALSSRPIAGVGRIWADGNLLRGAAGDLKTGGVLRIHTGHADQLPDPLMAASIGARCPAYRGCAYAVFEDLALEDFGNRIPAISFEVFAGTAQAVVEDIARQASMESEGTGFPELGGFVHEGGGLAAVLSQVKGLRPIHAAMRDGHVIVAGDMAPEDVPMLPPAVAAPDGEFGRASGTALSRRQGASQGASLLRYYDPTRDYQPGLQRSEGADGGETIEFPGVFQPEAARSLLAGAARREWLRGERLAWRTNRIDPALGPGSIVRAPGHPGLWQITTWEWRDTGIELDLARYAPAAGASQPADGGAAWSPPDRLPVETRLRAFELPWDGTGQSSVPQRYAAVSAPAGRWGGAMLYRESADTLMPIGRSGPQRAVGGILAEALPPSPGLRFEATAQVRVRLDDYEAALQPAGLDAIARGSNRLLIGGEIVQFAQCEPEGNGIWQLCGLLRGRGGTEIEALAGHEPGAPVTLLDDRLVPLPANPYPGDGDRIAAIGPGDDEPVLAEIENGGRTCRPLLPVHPRSEQDALGNLTLRWTRRARGGWSWPDGVEQPLVEQDELYEVGLGDPDRPARIWATAGPQLLLEAGEIAELGESYEGAALWVRQKGSFAVSPPLHLISLSTLAERKMP